MKNGVVVIMLFVLFLSPIFVSVAKEKLSEIKIESITEVGKFNGNKDSIVDENMPEKGSSSTAEGTLWWNDRSAYLIFDLGKVFKIQSINIEIDSNDSYHIDYSADGKEYKNLMKVLMTKDDVSIGLNIFSTDKATESYVKELEFKPVEARYLKLYAVEGDGMYSVAEFQVYGTTVISASTSKK